MAIYKKHDVESFNLCIACWLAVQVAPYICLRHDSIDAMCFVRHDSIDAMCFVRHDNIVAMRFVRHDNILFLVGDHIQNA